MGIFNKNKNKKSQAVIEAEAMQEIQKIEEYNRKINKELTIHSMPKKFLKDKLTNSGAGNKDKVNRVVIMILFIILLLAIVMGSVYFFLSKKTSNSAIMNFHNKINKKDTIETKNNKLNENKKNTNIKKSELDIIVEGLLPGQILPREKEFIVKANLKGDTTFPLKSVIFSSPTDYITIQKPPFEAKFKIPNDYEGRYVIILYAVNTNEQELKATKEFTLEKKKKSNEKDNSNIKNIASSTSSIDNEEIKKETINDDDNDGLSNKEEEIFGSDKNNNDSDEDGYTDLEEVLNLYNPVGAKKIINNKNIERYINKDFAYSLFYPKKWTKINIGGSDSVMFKSKEDGEFFHIIAQENYDNLSIQDWYEQQFGEKSIQENQKISRKTWDGIKNKDDLILYLTDKNKKTIFVLSYNSGVDKEKFYKNIFQMMINSFEISQEINVGD